MKNLFFSAIIVAGMLMLNSGCGHVHGEDTHVHDDNSQGDGGHLHEVEYPSASYTAWTDKSEIFVEYPVLAVNKSSRFAAHFSSMKTFKPITEGTVIVSLNKDGKSVVEGQINEPSSPGIFRPEIVPTEGGNYDLIFYVESGSLKDTFEIKQVKVYDSEHDALHNFVSPPDADGISFLKEQAWKIDFALAKVKKGDIQDVIRTSGEILPVESAEMAITSTTNGILLFKNKSLVEGQLVKKGTPLFIVNNDKMISSNLSEKYAITKANLDQSMSNLDRSKELLDKGIISSKEYEIRLKEYTVNLAEYETLNRNYNKNGMPLVAPMTGILKMLNTTDGQYVGEGQSIAVISSNTKLMVEAEVSQKHFKDISNIQSANIKLPWQDKVVNISEYNGRMINTPGMTTDHFIPVKFKIDNKGDIMPGAFLDVYLLTNTIKDVITIPEEALIKDYNMYSVYVMMEGELFERRNVTIGIQDGKQVQILSGLEEGEMVVNEGAYAIKMASMSSTIPAHGHEH